MHFIKTVLATISLLALQVAAKGSVLIEFSLFDSSPDGKTCDGDPLGEEDRYIEDGTCQTLDHWYSHFIYDHSTLAHLSTLLDDYDDPRCKVIVYGFDECKGEGWTPGPIADHVEQCLKVPEGIHSYNDSVRGWAKSVGVHCGTDAFATEGYVADGGIHYGEYNGP